MDFEQRREILITANEIQKRVVELAKQIAEAVQAEEQQGASDLFQDCIVLLCVLDSAFVFATALQAELNRLRVTSEMAYVKASSYGCGMESNGNPQLTFKDDADQKLAGRRVWVVEDMIDSGTTLKFLVEVLQKLGLASLNVVVLLQKIREACDIGIGALVGFLIPFLWVDGYGIDTDKQNRELVDIWSVLLNVDNEKLWQEFRAQMGALTGQVETI